MRIRLMPFLVIFIALTLIISSLAFYYYLRQKLTEDMELRLFNYADNIIVEIAKDPDIFIKQPSDFIFSSTGNEFISGGVLVQFVSVSGEITARSPALKNNSLYFEKDENELLKDIEMEDGTKIKTFQRMIEIHDTKLGYVIVGLPSLQILQALGKLQWLLGFSIVILIVILGIGIGMIVSMNLITSQKLFLAFASHELRTPLSVISGHAEIALRSNSSEQQKEALALIKEEAGWMNSTVSNLLLMLKSQTGSQKLNRTVFNLSELLVDAISNLKKRYPQKQVTLILPDRAEIDADRNLLRMLVGNLLENAAKHTAENGKIKVEFQPSSKGYLLSFTDDGPGINHEVQGKIFNPYYQAGGSKSPGFGLGLAIAKWVADAHGGRIELASEPGKNTTFTVHLPQ